MKVHRKRFTIMRTAAIAGCVAGLAVPSIAGAMPLPADPPSPSPVVLLNHAKPTAIGADTLSSQSKTTGGTFAVHEVRTVSHSDDPTLAIVLASAALGIALFGTGYALTRVASMQRRAVRTS
jgi:hypothetical protein